jgi:hypothetical protein
MICRHPLRRDELVFVRQARPRYLGAVVRAVQKRVRSPLHFEPEPKKAHRRDYRAGLSETGGS